MKAQVDSCPSDQSRDDEEDQSIFWEPCRQKSRHHKRTKGMGAGKTGVKNFSLTFRKLNDRLQKYQWPLTVDEKFDAVGDRGLNGIKEKETE